MSLTCSPWIHERKSERKNTIFLRQVFGGAGRSVEFSPSIPSLVTFPVNAVSEIKFLSPRFIRATRDGVWVRKLKEACSNASERDRPWRDGGRPGATMGLHASLVMALDFLNDGSCRKRPERRFSSNARCLPKFLRELVRTISGSQPGAFPPATTLNGTLQSQPQTLQ